MLFTVKREHVNSTLGHTVVDIPRIAGWGRLLSSLLGEKVKKTFSQLRYETAHADPSCTSTLDHEFQLNKSWLVPMNISIKLFVKLRRTAAFAEVPPITLNSDLVPVYQVFLL